ncbi:MAG: hypothetical protein L7U87_08185 [Chlamydiales bacterium]|nr:hypothetical protein [Chlamydiales bacterium]
MNLREIFGQELKNFVINRKPITQIGSWAFSFYWDNIEQVDSDFEDVLLILNKMELGEEFAFSYEELGKIADDLISGKEPDL